MPCRKVAQVAGGKCCPWQVGQSTRKLQSKVQFPDRRVRQAVVVVVVEKSVALLCAGSFPLYKYKLQVYCLPAFQHAVARIVNLEAWNNLSWTAIVTSAWKGSALP